MGSSFRLFKILRVLFSERIDELLPQPKRGMLKALAWCVPSIRMKRTRGERLRDALQTLGPVFVKFGQMLSTRPDLFPEDIVHCLEKLQDRVPAFDSETAISMVEKNYRKPINELFLRFDKKPLASASIAQVHAATCKSHAVLGAVRHR